MRETGPIASIFLELVEGGHINPVVAMEELRLPGELPHVPSYISYGTPDVKPVSLAREDAKLGYCT